MPRKETTFPRMKIMKQILYIALFSLLVGCATIFRPWKFSEVKAGMDRAQVGGIIGEPDYVESRNGAEFLYYSYSQDYDPFSGKAVWEHSAKQSLEKRNYVVKLVGGKVQYAKELPPTSTL